MKTIYIKLLLIIAVIMSGCDLEEKIYDAPIAETSIKSQNDVFFQLNGAYSYFTTFSSFKSNLPYQIIMGGDDIATTNSIYRLFTERTISTSNSYFTGPWMQFFQTINSANALKESLEKLDEGILTTSYKERALGELYFMRAISYFYLVRLYGAVPIHTNSVNGGSDFYPKRNTVEEVYNLKGRSGK